MFREGGTNSGSEPDPALFEARSATVVEKGNAGTILMTMRTLSSAVARKIHDVHSVIHREDGAVIDARD